MNHKARASGREGVALTPDCGVRHFLFATLLVLSAGLSSCATSGGQTSRAEGETLTAKSLSPHENLTSEAAEDFSGETVGEGERSNVPNNVIIKGTGAFVDMAALRERQVTLTKDGVTLNFVDADIREVAGTLLGEVLGLNFAISPSVVGTLTLQSSNPVSKDGVFAILEEAMAINGMAVIEASGIFSIIPAQDAQARVRALRPIPSPSLRPQGYGIRIVPLKYVSASEMEEILQPFAPQANVVRVDEARNLLLIAGTEQEVSALQETVDVFDVDWMRGMSVGLFEVNYLDVETIVAELEDVLKGPDSPMEGMLRLLPMPRLNSIMAMTPQPAYLDQVEIWINRLDRGHGRVEGGAGRRVYVYHVQNGKAEDLVASLDSILGSSSSADARSEDAPQAGVQGYTASGAASGQRGGDSDRAETRASAFGGDNSTRLVADDKNNAILVFASAEEYGVILSALDQLDTTPLQVLIEATIVEVGLTDDLNYGVQWFFQESKNRFDFSDGGIPAQAFPGFSYAFRGTDAQVVLNALDSVTDIDVISSPQLMVVNNETANLQVGDQVPVPVQSVVAVGDPDAPIVNSIQFKDSGVILSVTPRINKNGSVFMEIELEVSDVAPTVSSGIDAPTFQQRSVSSTVVVDDGETIALGGLIRENKSKARSGVPLLKDIPVLGLAFSSTTDTSRRTELLIFITPRVIRNMKDARETTRYLRNRLDGELFRTRLEEALPVAD